MCGYPNPVGHVDAKATYKRLFRATTGGHQMPQGLMMLILDWLRKVDEDDARLELADAKQRDTIPSTEDKTLAISVAVELLRKDVDDLRAELALK